VVQALVAALTGRQQQGGDAHLVEIGLQITSVTVGHLEAEAVDHRLGLQARVKRHATLGRHFGIGRIEKVAIQLIGRIVQFEGGDSCILQADHVGILGLQPAEQTSLDCGLNTIHVHTDDPHKWPPKTPACMIPELIPIS